MTELLRSLFFIAFSMGCAIHCGRLAKVKGRNAGLWACAGVLTQLFVVILLHLLKARNRTCPQCRATFLLGVPNCPSCGVSLPDAYALSRLVAENRAYDGECAQCGTPYALSDYKADALECHCSRCRAPLSIRPRLDRRLTRRCIGRAMPRSNLRFPDLEDEG